MPKGRIERIRKDFGKIEKILDLPYLVEMQKNSYRNFLQKDVLPENRQDIGLQEVFKSVFPIQDFTGTAQLEFVKYGFEELKYDEEECKHKGLTYEAPVKITVRLIVFDNESEGETKSVRDIKEQEIYFGTLPVMTERGAFVINGTERVVVSQLHRSPGVFFDHDKGKSHSSGKVLYSARIIPARGSWLDFEFDHKDILYSRIDRRRKFPATVLLKALGYSSKQIMDEFYNIETIWIEKDRCLRENKLENLHQKRISMDIVDPDTGEVIATVGEKYTKRLHKILVNKGINKIPMSFDELEDRVLAEDLIDPETGEILGEVNQAITPEIIEIFKEKGIKEIKCYVMDAEGASNTIRDTMLQDKVNNQEEALLDIYRKMRPSSPPTIEVAESYFESLFFNEKTYDLSKVGRLKINHRLNLETPADVRVLTPEDIMATVKELINLKETESAVDDIDSLGNRRVRAVGELLENEYRVGLIRMERAIKERMALHEVETLMPYDLVNSKPVSAVVNEFFGTSQLSQFMDQTNPLSEITHKRRLSALGPGGLTRERAGFEVRDVHPTHYGRICPIETPEGPNIGLIVSLCSYAKVNDLGFIETPYRKVENGIVSKEIEYLSALDEKDYAIAQANAPIDEEGRFLRDEIAVRKEGEAAKASPEEIKYMDVAPNQIVSVSSSLIPFLEHDDANRALMGSNMMRQAVPLLKTSAPLVGTGMEKVIIKDSGNAIVAKRDGVVEDVDASRIVIRSVGQEDSEPEVEIYRLEKFRRSNQDTCYNQKPIVKKGDFIKKGQIIADGPSSDKGELALGQNVLVAFMSWAGYNFEDSILISERLVRDDIYTSIHIEEFELIARDTKLGREEVTRDIPNVGEEALRHLDECGIAKIGAEVKAGDILVGKVTPKGETQLTPEEKLLRAIFGDKASDVKDTSLRVPPGTKGVVIDVKVFTRKGIEKDKRTIEIEEKQISDLKKDVEVETNIITTVVKQRLKELLVGKSLRSDLYHKRSKKLAIKAGKEITAEDIDNLPLDIWRSADIKVSLDVIEKVDEIISRCLNKIKERKNEVEERRKRIKAGDDLPPGVIKMVKVYLAVKRKLSVGDKMAGRHGNKGVLSRILPIEDMPYFEDGTPVDMVLNPLGVPSRMNVGQVLETHLGWASKELGRQIAETLNSMKDIKELQEKLRYIFGDSDYNRMFGDMSDEEMVEAVQMWKEGIPVATPVFDGAKEDEIKALLEKAGLPTIGKTTLYDGRTGEPFDQKITVGVMYVIKLHHLVDDKIHARSIGPYSLVTQQPLGGKAQFGGQRLGEMEVWAIEAYGAAYALQEFLTVKSDDVAGRTRMYEKIVKGNNILEPGVPESFKVLVKELQSLAFNVELFEDTKIQ
ncbi:MAG: DNA-directed RNA polymerase subunit beta [Deltaproteobacteria bacterium]|nr:MAG: DNA-directed RNA polymerase subunit beta [Deltaproteobacteria bacterium]